MNILIFGASGMLGHVLFDEFRKKYTTLGVCRSHQWHPELLSGVDVRDHNEVERIIKDFNPDYIINAVGIIKQLEESKNKLLSIEINASWPHRLAQLAKSYQAKVIHFSTDCIFTGSKGMYQESDPADARDVYGLTKYLGEIDQPHCLTLRTSIIGHELKSHLSLIDWFLSQQGEIQGFDKAIYSGLPTIVMAEFIEKYVFNQWFSGVYHLSTDPISKYQLLNLVAKTYQKEIAIEKNEKVKIDRSLNSSLLKEKIHFSLPKWEELIEKMYQHFCHSGLYQRKC